MKLEFKSRDTIVQVEESTDLAPKFDKTTGLMPVATTDHKTGELLMLGYMNQEAFTQTITTGFAHYYSRSRQTIWRKGETSGLTQKIVQMLIDDDQDAAWIRVDVGGNGASCHVGYRSCFYREIPTGETTDGTLVFTEQDKKFDPEKVYAGQPNPTKL